MKGIGAWDSLCEGCLDTKCEMLAPGFEGDYLDDRLLLAGLKMEIDSRDPRKFTHRSEAELLDAVERLAWQGVNAKRVAAC